MLNNDQIWTLVIGVLLGLSEIMGMFKRGPNGILQAVWRFYNLKVEVEYVEEEEVGSGGVRTIDERLDQGSSQGAEGAEQGVLLVRK